MYHPIPQCDSLFMNNDLINWTGLFFEYEWQMDCYEQFLYEIDSPYHGPLYALPHQCYDVLVTNNPWIHIRNPVDFPMGAIHCYKPKRKRWSCD